ncbi:MAG: hypothetical protein QOH04_1820 [Sphingomonadales bacterium]|jgi:hypothetical protein|nr:hypothetical protein [Sphingomonadales bacterium]
MLLVLLTLAFFVAIWGIIKPFKGLRRKHFAMIAAGIFVLCLVVTPKPENENTKTASQAAMSPAQRAKEEAERYRDDPKTALEVTDLDWSKGGFGAIMMVDATIKNHAAFPIKDFQLRCVHQGASGTDMDENTRTVYDIVPANGTRRIRDMNMGFMNSQVTSSRCEITGAVKA